MNLDESQKQKVRTWIDEGLKLAEIQGRLDSDFGLKLTYMEIRLLVDDLKLIPKDPPPPPEIKLPPATPTPPKSPASALDPADKGSKPSGGVAVAVDAVSLPGAMVSGTVTFSDGQTGKWYIDETGQLGVAPSVKGYRPPQADMAAFQGALQQELRKLGYA